MAVSRMQPLALIALLLSIAVPETGAGAPAEGAKPAESAPPGTAGTIGDPAIDLGDLKLLLEPLTRAELAIEANGWFGLLRAKVREVSEAELAVRRKNREIVALNKVKDAAKQVAAASVEAEKKAEVTPAGSAEEAAAAAKLAEANAKLEKSVETSKKAAATAPTAVLPAPSTSATPAQATAGAPVADDQEIMKRAVATAQKQAEKTGDPKAVVDKAVAATKESQASQAITLVAEQKTAAPATPATDAASASAEKAIDSTTKAQTLVAKVDEAAAAKTDVKVQLVDYSTQLGNERTQIIDRIKVVLDELDRKGGDSKDIRQFVAAVGGLKVDVSDTTATAARVKSWLLADEGGVRLARNTGQFLAYVIGSFLLAWIVRMVMSPMLGATRHGPSQLLRQFILDMSGRAIVFVGVLAGLSALEINLSPLLAVIGAAGFVVAFALQGTLSNFASGLLIMLNKPFDVGDHVDVGGGIKGRVGAVSIFSTLIRTDDGLTKIVPNNTIWSGVIINETTGTVSPPPEATSS
jgi:small conductance mechanosensitive channel